jgi:hypothetical protein
LVLVFAAGFIAGQVDHFLGSPISTSAASKLGLWAAFVLLDVWVGIRTSRTRSVRDLLLSIGALLVWMVLLIVLFEVVL